MDKKQTALEWLKELFIDNKYLSKDAEHLFEEAKAMEKEQIREAYYTSLSSQYWHKGEQWLNEESEIYYNSTYGQ